MWRRGVPRGTCGAGAVRGGRRCERWPRAEPGRLGVAGLLPRGVMFHVEHSRRGVCLVGKRAGGPAGWRDGGMVGRRVVGRCGGKPAGRQSPTSGVPRGTIRTVEFGRRAGRATVPRGTSYDRPRPGGYRMRPCSTWNNPPCSTREASPQPADAAIPTIPPRQPPPRPSPWAPGAGTRPPRTASLPG